jgi:hypothetical protein
VDSHLRVSNLWGILLSLLGLCLGACSVIPDRSLIERTQQTVLDKPTFGLETSDLYYPDWFLGRWQVVATLESFEAPQGQYGDRASMERAIKDQGRSVRYPVRFYRNEQGKVIADRAFNAKSITEAYLGPKTVREVVFDPQRPDRQTVLLLSGSRGELYITQRRSESPEPSQFNTLEFYRQVLGTLTGVPKTKDIEAVTLYRRGPDPKKFQALQQTAVFLVPTDPAYFQSQNKAVTLYRYRLNFQQEPLP